MSKQQNVFADHTFLQDKATPFCYIKLDFTLDPLLTLTTLRLYLARGSLFSKLPQRGINHTVFSNYSHKRSHHPAVPHALTVKV